MSTPPKLGQYPYPQHDDKFDSPALKWLRNQSDYLRGEGFLGTLSATVIYLRGFIANLLIVFPCLLRPLQKSLGLGWWSILTSEAFLIDWL